MNCHCRLYTKSELFLQIFCRFTMSKPLVYWMSGSPPCWKVFLTLQECSVRYKEKLLSASQGEVQSPEMLKLNPRGTVPVYVEGGTVIVESLATCLYIVSQCPKQTLLPTDGATKALVLQRLMESNIMQDVNNQVWYNIVAVPKDERNPSVVHETKELLIKELTLWEHNIGSKEYMAGDTFTLADCGAFPHIALWVRLGVRLYPRFPNLKKYYVRLCQRASVKKTWPPLWTGDNWTSLTDLYQT